MNFKMELKEEILRNSGLINDEKYYNDVVLVEGIRFFKNSKRLRSLGRKILKKAGKIKGIKIGLKSKQDLVSLVKKIEEVASAFERTENVFATAKKMKDKPKEIAAKLKYKELKSKHVELLKMLKKESVKKALKTVGAVGLAAGVALVAYHFLAANAIGMTALISGSTQQIQSLETGKIAKGIAQKTVEQETKWKGIIPIIGQFFVDMTDSAKKLFMGGGPTAAELRNLVGQNATQSLAAANAINMGLAAAGGLTAAGAGSLLSKLFGKFRKAKSYIATEKVIKDLKVTTNKEEKESKKALQEA